jgi:YHS domain-containing protein
MRIVKVLFLALVLGIFAAGPVLAAAPKPQTVCPVLGGNINKQIYVDYQGKRIYFCCEGCDKEFRKNPEKYLKKMEEQGIIPEQSPEAKK